MEKKGAIKYTYTIRFILAIPILFSVLIAGNAAALPCKGQTVNIGETMSEVAEKCGEAAFKEQRAVTVEETDEKGTSSSATAIDEWAYLSGPAELIQSYRFKNGKVFEIRNVGYGRPDFFIDACRNGEDLKVDESTVETYLKCGEPLAKEKREDKVLESESSGKKTRIFLPVVEWTYRYGPNAPGYTVTFENGVAAKIRTREFGK